LLSLIGVDFLILVKSKANLHSRFLYGVLAINCFKRVHSIAAFWQRQR